MCAFRFLVGSGYHFQVDGTAPWSLGLKAAQRAACNGHTHEVETLDCLVETTAAAISDDIAILRLHQYIDAEAASRSSTPTEAAA